uniref:Uncharacterized protein n=1 Tax=Vitis vinifera TaxID=29760 RepID=A5BS22_VITVI|nr:hypothetical protein VITISV_038595 [Vitis vinifera]
MEANLHEFPKASEKEIKLSEGSLKQQAKHSRLDELTRYGKYGSLGDSSKGAAWRCPSQNVDCAPPPKAAARECHHLNYAVALKKKDCARVVILHYGKWIARLTIALHQALKCAMNDYHSNGDRVGGAILEEGSVRKQIRRVGFYVEEIIFVWPRAELPVRTVGGGVGDGILVAMRKLLEQAAISTWKRVSRTSSNGPPRNYRGALEVNLKTCAKRAKLRVYSHIPLELSRKTLLNT